MKPPTTWSVYQQDSSFYVKDLAINTGIYDLGQDTMLLHIYPEGDCDNPYNQELMNAVLYDLYQCDDRIKEDDRFETPFGEFFCWSVHVSPMDDWNQVQRERVTKTIDNAISNLGESNE